MQESLGEYLRQIRKEKRLTLRDVEEKTGISNAYLSQIENQKILKPSPSILYKLAEIYDVSYEHLMRSVGYPVTSHNHDTVLFRTSTGLKEITKEEEKELLEYLKFIRMRRLGK